MFSKATIAFSAAIALSVAIPASIAVLMSIGRRAYLAKDPTTFPRHRHLVHRYARIVGRNAYKMHQPTQLPKKVSESSTYRHI